jgi:hypothetical protein
MPALNLEAARKRLQAFEFEELFVEELGWDRHRHRLTVTDNGSEFTLSAAAQKRGFVVFVCEPTPGAPLPAYAARLAIEAQVAKHAHEHIIVFVDVARTRQVWQWVRREPGKPLACRETPYVAGQSGELVLQRLAVLAVDIAEEDELTLVAVAGKARKAFDVDRVTKRFYDEFKGEHKAFLQSVSGIPDSKEQDWYTSVMLNRLMFVYFIQKKGFLDGNRDYLRTKLHECRARFGTDQFYSFYRTFLLRLFHQGLGLPRNAWPTDLAQLVGNVPHINGGIFQPHVIETKHEAIAIPDEAFGRVFTFFDRYQWHLDDRPARSDNEINPDVLGYIFEKYINQKEMGAYYTKEDITEYIGRSTIVPRLLDMAREGCPVAFEPDGPVWSFLSDNPDRYIFEPVRRGVVREDGTVIPETDLPDFVQTGMQDPRARMFDKRYNLGEADLRDAQGRKLTLPTETWREYGERRKRCLELRETLRRGEVYEVNDLITYNLDLRQLVQDVVERCGPDLLMAFWRALTRITVLDPTVGSGAFLFAALNILEPLYEAALGHMEALIADRGIGPTHEAHQHAADVGAIHELPLQSYREFRTILARMAEHPNRRYYILKTIIVNNLFGVDLMQEAVEICKLRLFLKLAAQVERADQMEPLPDIDFNIRCGNTLVGYARIEDIDRLWSEAERHTLISERDHSKLKQMVAEYAEMLDYWRRGQLGLEAPRKVGKADLEHARNEIVPELNRDLRRLYLTAKKLTRPMTRGEFVRSHQPFHWFVEFPQAMATGGFEVVIGNPPYVSHPSADAPYEVIGCRTRPCRNLWAYCSELALGLLTDGGRIGMIVQLSLTFSREFGEVRRMLLGAGGHLRVSSFDNIPDKLFTGDKQSDNTSKANQQRISIFVLHKHRAARPRVEASPLVRWRAEERPRLFAELPHCDVSALCSQAAFPKVGTERMRTFLERWLALPRRLADLTHPRGAYPLIIPKTAGYYIAAYVGELDRTKQMTLMFDDAESRAIAIVLLNSDVFFWFWRVFGDGFDVHSGLVERVPAPSAADAECRSLAEDLQDAAAACTVYKGYRGVKVPNVNYNLRMDLLWRADEWLIHQIAPDLGLTPLDFIWAKSNSFLSLCVPKSANWPVGLG